MEVGNRGRAGMDRNPGYTSFPAADGYDLMPGLQKLEQRSVRRPRHLGRSAQYHCLFHWANVADVLICEAMNKNFVLSLHGKRKKNYLCAS